MLRHLSIPFINRPEIMNFLKVTRSDSDVSLHCLLIEKLNKKKVEFQDASRAGRGVNVNSFLGPLKEALKGSKDDTNSFVFY